MGSVCAHSKECFLFDVSGRKNNKKIYPYFDNHSFMGWYNKGQSYLKFKELFVLLEQKAHLDPDIRPLLAALAKKINPKNPKLKK